LNKGKFADMQLGDTAVINDVVEVEIVRTRTYDSFRDMIQNEGIEKVIPGAHSLEDAINVYYKFYTREQEKKYGVRAIEIKLI